MLRCATKLTTGNRGLAPGRATNSVEIFMTQRTKRILHYWLSIPGALFFLLWIFSGIALVWDSIRGGLHAFPDLPKTGDLRKVPFSSHALFQNIRDPISRISLFYAGTKPYAEITTSKSTFLIDADYGEILTPLNRRHAMEMLSGLAGY